MPLDTEPFHIGCPTCGPHTPQDRDAARRMSDDISLHLVAQRYHATEAVNRWVAFRLADGVSDHQLYDTKAEAMHFAPVVLGCLDTRCLYVQVPLTGMPAAEALHVLALWRQDWLDTTAPVDDINPFAAHPLAIPKGVRLS